MATAPLDTLSPMTKPPGSELYEVTDDRRVILNFHEGQQQAWDATERFVAVFAGSQGGKTSFGPWWMAREIATRGSGDYLAVTSTYDLFSHKMLPTLQEVFENVLQTGRYWPSTRVLEIAEPNEKRFLARRATDPMYARIMLRSADTGGGLEAATAKGAWLDEAGMDKFRLETWRAVLRRLSLSVGRALLTTTLYNFNWMKTEIYERAVRGEPGYKVVHFDSTANPNFPKDEWERAKRELPAWYFDMQYRGLFARPAGLIYDCFNDSLNTTENPTGHLVKRFPIPEHWPRYLGLDFGGKNTAGVFFAVSPNTGNWVAYREYKEGDRTAAQHAAALLQGEPRVPTCFGGSKSEGQWRDEFRAAGLPVWGPDISDVRLGILRVYGAMKANRVYWMDDLTATLTELRAYSRKLDGAGLPTDEIQDKAKFHLTDASRYILGWANAPSDTQSTVGSTANPTADRRWGA